MHCKQQVLSIEQMEELKNLGINISNASCMWVLKKEYLSTPKLRWILNHHDWCIPRINPDEAWYTYTSDDIMGMLPKKIEHPNKHFEHRFSNASLSVNFSDGVWSAMYIPYISRYDIIYKSSGEDKLQVLYDTLKWCKINNHI